MPLDEGESVTNSILEGDIRNESNIGSDAPAGFFAADDRRGGGVFDAADALKRGS